jgi:hypothetical protein
MTCLHSTKSPPVLLQLVSLAKSKQKKHKVKMYTNYINTGIHILIIAFSVTVLAKPFFFKGHFRVCNSQSFPKSFVLFANGIAMLKESNF